MSGTSIIAKIFVPLNDSTNTTLENHCTGTAQASRVGCSRQGHIIVFLAVKKVNILVNFLLLKVFFANYCLLYIQLCICLTIFM